MAPPPVRYGGKHTSVVLEHECHEPHRQRRGRPEQAAPSRTPHRGTDTGWFTVSRGACPYTPHRRTLVSRRHLPRPDCEGPNILREKPTSTESSEVVPHARNPIEPPVATHRQGRARKQGEDPYRSHVLLSVRRGACVRCPAPVSVYISAQAGVSHWYLHRARPVNSAAGRRTRPVGLTSTVR